MRQGIRFETLRAVARVMVGLLAVGGAATVLPAAAAPLPVADFFRPAALSELTMSPSGKYISALVVVGDGRKQLAVLDPSDLSKSRIVASTKDADVRDPRWVNDERLVFTIYDRKDSLLNYHYAALLAVNASGSDAARFLVRPFWSPESTGMRTSERTLAPNHRLHSVLRDGSNDVIVEEYVFDQLGDIDHVGLKRLDTVTGLARSLTQGAPRGAIDWALDSAGKPRVVRALQGPTEALYWKATPDAEWSKVQEVERASSGGLADPLYVDAGNRLFANARADAAEDNSSLITVAMAADGVKSEPLLSASGYDIDATLVLNRQGAVLGLRYLTDARATYWIDPGLKKIQDQVNAVLPGSVNEIDCGDCEHREKVLVTSWSDRQPESFWLFDVATARLQPIGSSRPWIKPATMAQRDLVRIDVRDGLSMPVHVTRPKGAKGPQPSVVLVHGGPFLRGGEWKWDEDSQFLASRGYVVIEPEFRGSAGFGYRHYRAGWKQWGLKMQDDVADAAQWAIKQGYADPTRVCIAGASYGGYATLMGLIRNPELFRCGFEWAGVTDIDLMYSINWSDTSVDLMKYNMPSRVGDPVKDAAQLAATSPIRLADKLTQPLLMAYGGLDQRVPIEHGTLFRDAVRKHNKQVEWIDYPDEGHGWATLTTDVDFWTRVETFLDKNLRGAAP